MGASLGILAITLAAGAAGFVAGMLYGEHDGGDYNFAPLWTAPIGACIGGIIGLIVALVILN